MLYIECRAETAVLLVGPAVRVVMAAAGQVGAVVLVFFLAAGAASAGAVTFFFLLLLVASGMKALLPLRRSVSGSCVSSAYNNTYIL